MSRDNNTWDGSYSVSCSYSTRPVTPAQEGEQKKHNHAANGEGFPGSDQQQQQQQQQKGVFIRGADRRALQNLRVVRRNLVYAIGLSPNFAQVNTLKQPEYFGQYGEIAKLVINHHEGVPQDDPRYGSASAYITFRRQEDAWAAVCSVDGFRLMGRTIRASFGTTKYCNSFLRNLPCNNPDCLYLHELGDEEDRFTKDEVQLGLARHGSSFAFKEEVLGDRGNTAAPRPTNPVFPPPCAMLPAPYRREGAGKPQRDGGNMGVGGRQQHQHQHDCEIYRHGNTGGNGPPPPKALPMSLPPSPQVCHPCRTRGGGCCGGAFPGAEAARWAGSGAPLTPGSPLPLDGGGLSLSGSDERPRRRRHRGQRGRRGGATGAPGLVGHGNDGCGGPTAPAQQQYGHHAGVPNEYGEQMTPAGQQASHFELTAAAAARAGLGSPTGDVFRLPDHVFDRPFEFGGGGGGGRADDLSNGGGNPYYPAPQPAQGFGGGSYGSSAGWGKGRNSPLATPETLSNTPPLELSPLDGSSPTSASASFQGFGCAGGGASDPSAQELWNRTQYSSNSGSYSTAELSSVGDQLAALSWDDREDVAGLLRCWGIDPRFGGRKTGRRRWNDLGGGAVPAGWIWVLGPALGGVSSRGV
ncbi:conserved unknown protein [Ectocarpus siliculosus]|uniref:RRM domain-containing protein n=1 Tax=Ectocarpus siliculosus TaxID=2880 RepID=D7FX15_ECTSI|nr:conserved unknown protein [Ectocarpus siliculosus]|eukprot:CBJ26348.1 conserved unknown protein [Ectocarpus siliculosus]